MATVESLSGDLSIPFRQVLTSLMIKSSSHWNFQLFKVPLIGTFLDRYPIEKQDTNCNVENRISASVKAVTDRCYSKNPGM